tara:strand:- start:135 stop:833 length:699 start_codon:yes stop_codon:yes gene_type:complete
MIVSHQKIIRDEMANTEALSNMFGAWWSDIDTSIDKAVMEPVTLRTAAKVIEKYEYLGTMCNAPMYAYGIRWDGELAGVVVYGAPSPPIIATSVIGDKDSDKVIQLGRGACVHWAHPHAGSKLIAYSLKEIEKLGYQIVVAFTDPDAGEIGTLYQATNWLYCGATAKRPDYFGADGVRRTGHFRKGEVKELTMQPRTRKGRYVYLLGTKKQKRENKSKLLWPVERYPKRAGL